MLAWIQQLDESILLFIQNNLRSPVATAILGFFSIIGNSGIVWILLGLLLLAFRKTRRPGLDMLLCLAFCFVINNLILKNLIDRTRPYEVIDGLTIAISRFTNLDPHSFPSGHACSSFACAFALTRAYGKKGALAYIPAVLISISRPYIGVHYLTDILAGAAVGTLGAVFAYWLSGKVKPRGGELQS